MERVLAAVLSLVLALPAGAVPASVGAPPVAPAAAHPEAWLADAQELADQLEAGGRGDPARLDALRAGFLELRGRWRLLPRHERQRLAEPRARLDRAAREVLGELAAPEPDEEPAPEPVRRELDRVADSVERAGLFFDQARALKPVVPDAVAGEPAAAPPAVFGLSHPRLRGPGARLHAGRALRGLPPPKRRARLAALAASALGSLGRGAPPPATLEEFVDWLEKEAVDPAGRVRDGLVVEVTPLLEVYSRLGAGPGRASRIGPRGVLLRRPAVRPLPQRG